MAKKDNKKKKNNQGYGKVILVLGIMLALAIGANFVVPDMVKDIKNGDPAFTTIGAKIRESSEKRKAASKEESSDKASDDNGDKKDNSIEDSDYDGSQLVGSWVYQLNGKNIIFTFNPDGTGNMASEGYTSDMDYSIDGDIVTMNYYLDGQIDETEENQFEVDGDTLYLTQYAGSGPRNELSRYDADESSTIADEENRQPSEYDFSYDSDVSVSDSGRTVGDSTDSGDDIAPGGENLAQQPYEGGNESLTEGFDPYLVGSWVYDIDGSYAVFTFNDDGTGLMIADGQAADLEWYADGNIVTINYYVDGSLAETENNKYFISQDVLSLTSDSGKGRTNKLTKQ